MKERLKSIGLGFTLVITSYLITNYFYSLLISLLGYIVSFGNLSVDVLSNVLALVSTTIIAMVFYKVIFKTLKKETISKLENIGLFGSLFFLFLFNDLFYLVPFTLLGIDYNSLNINLQTLCSIFSSTVLITILFFIYKDYLKEKFLDFKKKENFNKYFDLGLKAWFIGLIGMSVCNLLIGSLTPVPEANNEVLVQDMLRQSPYLTFISAAFLAPILEEMLFRKSLSDIFKNKKVMVIASALIFGLLHVIFSLKTPWDLLYTIPYGFLGGAFAYTMYKEDNVFIPITFHMIHNGVLTLISIIKTVI